MARQGSQRGTARRLTGGGIGGAHGRTVRGRTACGECKAARFGTRIGEGITRSDGEAFRERRSFTAPSPPNYSEAPRLLRSPNGADDRVLLRILD
jgi:hypothetical protein